MVLGNLDDYQGETFAPTTSRKTIWILFALTIGLGLYMWFFDITGAFMAEKPTRDIYVTIDDKVYLLKYSLYVLKDASKIFNDGLVAHLNEGSYQQSRWDQCLFYKCTSKTESVYLLFHEDDFIVCGSNERIIDNYHAHMKTKYEITFNQDGIFLGIHIKKLHDDASILRKLNQMQNIFDKYLPNSPTLKTAPLEPMNTAYSKSFGKDNSPLADKTQFHSMLGAVMQLTDVRPDIAFIISTISQQQCNPGLKDEEALMYVIK